MILLCILNVLLDLLNPDEMKRRRDFYAENRVLEPGEVVETFNIAEDEIISLSIQFYERNKWVACFSFYSWNCVTSEYLACL